MNQATNLSPRLLNPGDIVIEVSGGSPTSGQTTGRALLIDERTMHALGKRVIPASFCKRVVINTEIADPRYVYYHLSEMYQSARAGLYEHQSTGISNFQFEFFLDTEEIRLPPLCEQRAIAGVLGALDDKIDQNWRTAQALERLAREIFRAWFVDFEPVKAKTAGAASFLSMPQQAFDALPSRFVDSEIGPVPEGWEVEPLAKVAYFP